MGKSVAEGGTMGCWVGAVSPEPDSGGYSLVDAGTPNGCVGVVSLADGVGVGGEGIATEVSIAVGVAGVDGEEAWTIGG